MNIHLCCGMGRRAEAIEDESWLSSREAELLVLLESKDSLSDVADEMSIEETTAQTINQRIRDKKKKSELTVELIEEVRN